MIDKISSRLTLAKNLGATHAIDSSKLMGSLEDAVRNVTDGLGSSLTIDTTGNISLIRSALDMTGILGRVILLGMSRESIDIDITKFKLVCEISFCSAPRMFTLTRLPYSQGKSSSAAFRAM